MNQLTLQGYKKAAPPVGEMPLCGKVTL